MEDLRSVASPEIETIAARPLPEQKSDPATAQTPSPRSKKRPLESNPTIVQSKYFKMRSLLKDLRPHFIEVLKTPNFRECKAAEEIRENVKIMMDLYTQMVTEKVSTPKGPTTTMDAKDSQKPRDLKPTEQERVDQKFAKPSENKQRAEDVSNEQPMVGGSAFGWNFVTFTASGSGPVYYGVTKESFRAAFRAAQVSSQGHQ